MAGTCRLLRRMAESLGLHRTLTARGPAVDYWGIKNAGSHGRLRQVVQLVLQGASNLQDAGIRLIASECTQLHTLMITGCDLLCGRSIAFLLGARPSLTQLGVQACGLEAHDARLILCALVDQSCNIQAAGSERALLGGGAGGSRDGEQLVLASPNPSSSWTHSGHQRAIVTTDPDLSTHKGLRVLDLTGNNLGAAGGMALAEYLRRNGSLEALGLFHNRLGNEGLTAVGRALTHNHHLKRLYVGANYTDQAYLDTSTLQVVAASLRRNTTLELLDMKMNALDQSSVDLLNGVAKGHPSLRSVPCHTVLHPMSIGELLSQVVSLHTSRYSRRSKGVENSR
eukprot:gene10958-12957_t